MNLSDMLVTLSQTSEIEQPGLFPFPFDMHVIFSCIALVFMAFQFFRERKPYQLIMAVAIPFSLVIWLSESRTLFFAVGIVEGILLLAAFITAIIFRNKDKAPENDSNDKTNESAAAEESVQESQNEPEATQANETNSENTES